MADNNNIFVLPETCGPLLREYYSKLLKEPIPQQLKDLLAMLEEASASTDAAEPADATAGAAGLPRGPQTNKSE